jgi:hypothetical protein
MLIDILIPLINKNDNTMWNFKASISVFGQNSLTFTPKKIISKANIEYA